MYVENEIEEEVSKINLMQTLIFLKMKKFYGIKHIYNMMHINIKITA